MPGQPSAARATWRAPGVAFGALLLSGTGCGARAPGPPKPAAAPQAVVLACAEQVRLPVGFPVLSTTQWGEDRLRGSCVRGASPECLFALEVPTRSDVRLLLDGMDFDASLVLLDASDERRHELACVDDRRMDDSHQTRLETNLAAGRYWVMVEGAGGTTGEFELFAELDPLPTVREACDAAEPLREGVAARGSTRGGVNQFSSTCAGGAAGSDHVYTLTVDRPSRLRVRQQADYDGAISLRERCEDPSSERVCNDDFRENLRSALVASVLPGTYYVITDSHSRAQSGDFALSFERTDAPSERDPQAVCRESMALVSDPGRFEVDTFHSPSLTQSGCGGNDAPEHVVAFDVGRPSVLHATLEDAELNAVLYVRRECARAASEVACVAAPRIDRALTDASLESGALVVALEPGRYTLFVDGAEPGEMGAAALRFSLEPLSSDKARR